jgi:hypothetical protein
MMNMESFWLPWLLCCPLLVDLRWIFTPAGILVMLSTQSMFAMQSWAPYFGWTGIGLAVWDLLKRSDQVEAPAAVTDEEASLSNSRFAWLRPALSLACAGCFMVPFLASTLLSAGRLNWHPPESVRSRSIGNQGFEVQVPGQPEGMALVCYAAEGKDRHHTVQVCLKYRGTELEAVPDGEGVYTDGKHWLREFFLQDGKLLDEYPEYIKSTFRPGSDPGVHLIFISPHRFGTPVEFSQTSSRIAASFHQLCASAGVQPQS